MLIKFELLRNTYYHKDFIIQIGGNKEIADTYYFWQDEFGEYADPFDGMVKSISDYLKIWVRVLRELPLNTDIFFPLDFSDEYIGGFKIQSLQGNYSIVYGYVYDINGLVIRIDDKSVYTNLNNKALDPLISFHMEKEEFIKSLNLSVRKL